jgi:hypothetical protein
MMTEGDAKMELNRRRLCELVVKHNLHRLSDETLEKIVLEIDDELDKAIEKELSKDIDCEPRGFSEDDGFSRRMESVEYTKVKIVDWLGNEGVFEIIRLIERDDDKYSCTFKNSIGDHETALVDGLDLIP